MAEVPAPPCVPALPRQSLTAVLAARTPPPCCGVGGAGYTPDADLHYFCQSFMGALDSRGAAPLVEVQHHNMHIMMLLSSQRLVLRALGAEVASCVSSFTGCAHCGAHPIITGGDWLLGAEEGARRARLSACSRCECAVYCNKACQGAHWKEHRRTCNPTTAMVLTFVDLGSEPPEDVKCQAIAAFNHAAAATGAPGPVPRTSTGTVGAACCERPVRALFGCQRCASKLVCVTLSCFKGSHQWLCVFPSPSWSNFASSTCGEAPSDNAFHWQ
jgi:hypothetical protein